MIPVAAKIRFLVSGYMDFQPTAQPLVAGVCLGLVAESPVGLVGLAGRVGMAGDAVNPSVGAWPRHPCRGHPRHPQPPGLRHIPAVPPATERKKKSKSKSGIPRALPHFDPRDLIHAWRGSTVSSKVDTHQPSPGNCRRRGGVGWRGVRSMDAAAKPPGMGLRRPRHPTPPRLPTEHPRAALALDLPASGRHYRGCRVQPCKEKGRLSAASLFLTSA
jgi:hypothetical protein